MINNAILNGLQGMVSFKQLWKPEDQKKQE